jgi:CheY-like chemotaxis protein
MLNTVETIETDKKLSRSLRIHYIEDNLPDVRLVKELLFDSDLDGNLNNLEISSTERLQDGLDYLQKNKVDVVLLDLSLPDCTGYKTIERIKSTVPDIPVIILTGSSLERESLKHCISSAETYLVKGEIDSKSLVQAIKNAIQNHDPQSGLALCPNKYYKIK